MKSLGLFVRLGREVDGEGQVAPALNPFATLSNTASLFHGCASEAPISEAVEGARCPRVAEAAGDAT
jgi:hypothetical protein